MYFSISDTNYHRKVQEYQVGKYIRIVRSEIQIPGQHHFPSSSSSSPLLVDLPKFRSSSSFSHLPFGAKPKPSAHVVRFADIAELDLIKLIYLLVLLHL